MADLPPTSSLGLEGMLSDGEIAPDRLITALNQFIGPTYNALNGQLSVANLRAEWIEARAVVPSSGVGLFAHYTASVATSLVDADSTIVNFNTATVSSPDVTTGAAWKYTAPAAGRYTISSGVGFGAVSAGPYFVLVLAKNGTGVANFGIVPVSAGDHVISGSATLQLAAGDYIDIRVYHQDGAARNTFTGSNCWVTVDAQSIPAAPSCFPLDIALNKLKGPPKAVFLAGAWTLPDPATSTILALSQPQWSFTTKEGRPHIRIRNVAGLVGGKSYKLRFLVVGE